MKLVNAFQMRKMEQIAIQELGIPSILLMENASIRIAEHCLRYIKNINNPKVLIVCGSGNNGGDGLAVARHLYNRGIDTNILLTCDTFSVKEDAAVNLAIAQNIGMPIEFIKPAYNYTNDQSPLNIHSSASASLCENELESHDLIIDAVFGTGLTRNIEGNVRQLIEAVNRYAKYVISVDIPSGVHSDTGRIMGCAVKANETVTLGFPKIGAYLYPGAEYTGKIHIEDISIPDKLIDRIEIKTHFLIESEAMDMLPARKNRSNKGDYGRVLVFAGSNEMPGAAALACSAAYMTGCGLVCACVVKNTASVIHHWQREVVTRIVPEKNGTYCKDSLSVFFKNGKTEISSLSDDIRCASVIVLGPGIGRNADVTEFVQELIKNANAPLVLDADALFAISGNVNILKELKTPCVITPHPGEMSRLTNLSVSEILDDTSGAAARFAKEYNTVTLLKDAHTVIANPDGEIFINTTGNNALSKA
ncbi:MAG: NAD(P)H-hydrate epimerase, partial [Treponema sp.]|nr:NAD(P)H-hydrate epimerase [Treponema sp.]